MKSQYEQHLPEIRALFEEIKTNDMVSVRDTAIGQWLRDMKAGDSVARSWMIATLAVLGSKGYEIKKKE